MTAMAVPVPMPALVAYSEDELGPDARPGPLYYVALGDSYSSGEGTPYVDPVELKAEYGVDTLDAAGYLRDAAEDDLGWLGDTGNGGDKCHRSAHAYGPRVWGMLDQQDPSWGVSFRACSGATTAAFWAEFKGNPAQVEAFAGGRAADLITTGFGGNDIGFKDIVETCVLESLANRYAPDPLDLRNGHGACERKHRPRVDAGLADLRANIRALYGQLKDPRFLNEPMRVKPGGQIIAIGYPRPFPPNKTGTCSLGTASSIGEETMRWINSEVVDALNTVIREEAQRARVFYLDTADYFAEGGRHDFCVDDGSPVRWINRIIPSDSQRSVHPTFPYHEKVAGAVLKCWNKRGADPTTTVC
ncbi:MAG TPA: SGNH/GDSL hydrolase family protein [Pseudonocardia sp.]|nr:SGNH/GDSL hydrolase family protein [Pseudonocardia sp.]